MATGLGTRKLSEVARHVVAPTGIVSTGWPDVAETCGEKLGLTFDAWQDGIGRLILAKRDDGSLAAAVGGVGMSLPRQVGKTHLLMGLIFGLCVNEPDMLMIWSANHARTHGQTFLQMQGFCERERVAPFVSRVFLGSGTEEIRFRNGSRLLFGARERGFGRGIPGVDALIMDEAQILSERALANMLATLNTSRLGLSIFAGTPPKPEDNSEVFRRMREDALSGEATDLVWVECSADDDADLDDELQWYKANASLGVRTPLTSVQRLRRKLDPESFRREALGVWDGLESSLFDPRVWRRLADAGASVPDRVALVVDVSPDRKWATIGVAGEVEDRTLVMCHSESGTDWVAPKLVELVNTWNVVEVALFIGGQASALQPDLTKANVEFVRLSAADMGSACAAFQQAVADGRVLHLDQDELNAAISTARTRRVGESERWDRRDARIDISPLVAVSGALWRWGMVAAPIPAIY